MGFYPITLSFRERGEVDAIFGLIAHEGANETGWNRVTRTMRVTRIEPNREIFALGVINLSEFPGTVIRHTNDSVGPFFDTEGLYFRGVELAHHARHTLLEGNSFHIVYNLQRFEWRALGLGCITAGVQPQRGGGWGGWVDIIPHSQIFKRFQKKIPKKIIFSKIPHSYKLGGH